VAEFLGLCYSENSSRVRRKLPELFEVAKRIRALDQQIAASERKGESTKEAEESCRLTAEMSGGVPKGSCGGG